MKLDVILPCKAYSSTLPKAVSSLNSWDLVRKIIIVGFLEEHRILELKNLSDHDIFYMMGGSGVYDAMNLGLSVATSEYVFFLGDDDKVCPMSDGVRRCLMTSGADIVLARVNSYDAGSGKVIRVLPKIFVSTTKLWNYWISLGWPHQGVFIKRRLHEPFDLNYKIISDNVHLLKILNTDASVEIFNHKIALFNVSGISSNDLARHKEWRSLISTEFKKCFKNFQMIRIGHIYNIFCLSLRGLDLYLKSKKN